MKKIAMRAGMALAAFSLTGFNAVYGQATSPGTRVLLNNQNRGTLMTAPSSIAAPCMVKTLQLLIRTGNDDLRGGDNNLNVEIHFAGGRMQSAKNVNAGANWPNNSQHTVVIPLNPEVAPGDIKEIHLIHLAQGSYHPPGSAPLAVMQPEPQALQGIHSEDNWDMADFQALGSSSSGAFNAPNTTTPVIPIASFGFHRFTGSAPDLTIAANPNVRCPVSGQVRQLQFRFRTGNDDLRGGNDNLIISIHFADGTEEGHANVNQGQRWLGGSMHSVEVMLDRAVTLDQIQYVTLATTFTGGPGGDNWDMDSADIFAFVDGVMRHVTTAGFHRFSSDWSGPKAKTLRVAMK